MKSEIVDVYLSVYMEGVWIENSSDEKRTSVYTSYEKLVENVKDDFLYTVHKRRAVKDPDGKYYLIPEKPLENVVY